jgi:hypothetical protein
MNPNPSLTSATPKRVVNDISAPPASMQSQSVASTALTPNIVNNIPMRTPDAAQSLALNDEEELDKIMNDVGKGMRADDKKPGTRGFLGFKKKSKSEATFSAQPIAKVDLKTQTQVHAQPNISQSPKPLPQSMPQVKIAAQPIKPTSAPPASKTSTKPILVVCVTIIVTGALITAAFYAYKIS